MNPIKQIMNSKYKFLFIGSIIALIIFIIGAVFITGLDQIITDKQVTYTEFTVVDKYVNSRGDHFYMVISDQNESFEIKNDDVGTEIFNNLEVGHHYHFVTQKMDDKSVTHIIKVYNESN